MLLGKYGSFLPLDSHRYTHFFHSAAAVFLVIMALWLPIWEVPADASYGLAIACIIFAGCWREKWHIVRKNPVAIAALVFYALFFIGMTYTHTPFLPATHALRKYFKLFGLVLMISYFVLQPETRKWVIRAFLTGVFITVFFGYLRAFHLFDIAQYIMPVHAYNEPGTIYINHVLAGLIFGMAYFLLLCIAWQAKGYWRYWYGLLIVVLLYDLLFMAIGRTTYIIVFLASIVFVLQQIRPMVKKILAILMIILLVGMVSALSPKMQKGLANAYRLMHYKICSPDAFAHADGRMTFLQHSWTLWKHSPIWGYGTHSFQYVYMKPPWVGHSLDWHGAGGISEAGQILVEPHNQFAMAAVEFGIIGLALFIYLLYAEFRLGLLLEDPFYRSLGVGLAIIFAATCFSDAMLYIPLTGRFFVLFSALIFSNPTKPKVAKQ